MLIVLSVVRLKVYVGMAGREEHTLPGHVMVHFSYHHWTNRAVTFVSISHGEFSMLLTVLQDLQQSQSPTVLF